MTESTLNHQAYENALFDLCRSLLASILLRDAKEDEAWNQRIKTLE